jgi:hypothetical protein
MKKLWYCVTSEYNCSACSVKTITEVIEAEECPDDTEVHVDEHSIIHNWYGNAGDAYQAVSGCAGCNKRIAAQVAKTES